MAAHAGRTRGAPHRARPKTSAAPTSPSSCTSRTRRSSALNERFKALCGDWQLRDGSPNDHTDAAYDAEVVEAAGGAERRGRAGGGRMGDVLARLAPYGPRLARTCQRVVEGETKMFTGVMCGSYHDVWMELHEDLILTQGIDRSAEGSF